MGDDDAALRNAEGAYYGPPTEPETRECGTCEGTGLFARNPECDLCAGEGYVKSNTLELEGYCPKCAVLCATCEGVGRVAYER